MDEMSIYVGYQLMNNVGFQSVDTDVQQNSSIIPLINNVVLENLVVKSSGFLICRRHVGNIRFEISRCRWGCYS